MIDNKLKQMTREILQPFFDELVETSCRIFSSVSDNLPESMPIEEKDAIVKSILDKQCDALVAGLKSSIPEDFEEKLKEAFDGKNRRS